MKKVLVICLSLGLALNSFAQKDKDFPYTFSEIKSADATDVKDQNRTGTCWSFATSSFLESELMRMGKGRHDLSEMFNVRVTYPLKAENYVRYQGKTQFGPGSLSHDVIIAMENYGLVPEEVYSGLNYGKDKHDHGELDAVLEAVMKSLAERGQLTDKWDDAVAGVLDAYLGEYPAKFSYQGKEYTPESFRDAMGMKASDYVSLTSFSHHPFHEEFILEVPDNWSKGEFYNLPLNELMSVVNNALTNGYTIAWDADVSENGFSFRNGMAILPEKEMGRSDLFKEVVKEKKVTQENRQEEFNKLATTDDHLMHITGTAKDQNGTLYYITKNSWGQGNELEGYQYVSESYFRMKTVGIVIHKDALPKELKKKMGL